MSALFNLLVCLGFISIGFSKADVLPPCPSSTLEQARQTAGGPLTDFAINFYKNVSSTMGNKNVILSPVSVALGLALLENGASGATRQEIMSVLVKTGGSAADVVAVYGFLQQQLQVNQPKTKLSIANGVFPDNSLPLKIGYKTSMEQCYQASSIQVDFKRLLEESRQKINNWVSEKTMKKIPELFKANVLTPNVAMVLANAIYFKASWRNAFNSYVTKEGKFYRLGREQDVQMVPFMKDRGEYGYAKTNEVEVLEMAYDNKDFSMYIIKPNARDGLANFESNLNGEKLRSLTSKIQSMRVSVELPKFTVRTSIQLRELLIQMGLEKMFSDGAEFARMSDAALKVSKAVHEAYIKVNENGTEAAAATGISLVPRSGGNPQIEFVANHPFFYAIVHKPTGAIIFFGKVNFIDDKED